MLKTSVFARACLAVFATGLLAPAAHAESVGAWRSLFDAIPAPPKSNAEAAAKLRVVGAAGQQSLEFGDATVLKLRAQEAALRDAAQKSSLSAATKTVGSAAGGIDFGRMQSDPAYAQEVQGRMQSMSDAERMQAAMQINSSYQQQAMRTVQANPGLLQASTQAHNDPVRTSALQTPIDALQKRYEQQHLDLDSKLATQINGELERCPETNQCGEAGCARLASCEAPIRARLPAALQTLAEQHHQLATQELAEAAQLYATAHAALASSTAKLLAVATQAETNGASGTDLAPAAGLLDENVGYLLTLSRSISLHAGYWAGVRAHPASAFGRPPLCGFPGTGGGSQASADIQGPPAAGTW